MIWKRLSIVALVFAFLALVGAGSQVIYTVSLGRTTAVFGRVQVPFTNYSGGYLHYGDLVVFATYDNGGVLVVDTVANTTATTFTLADSLLNVTDALALGFYFYNASNCSAEVFGLDSSGTATAETLAYGTGDGWDYSAYRYNSVDSVKSLNGGADDSLFVYGIPYRGVSTTTSADATTIAGAVGTVDSVANYGVVQVVVGGVAQVKLKAGSTASTPGIGIESTTTAGYGIPVASPTAYEGAGKAVDARGADGLVPVLLDLH